MKRKKSFASVAKTVFALAAVVMMSTMFTSCSKDHDEKFTNTVTIGDEESSIFQVNYYDEPNGNYRLFLDLSANGGKAVEIHLNKEQHMNGTPIDLKKKEEREYNGRSFWSVAYYDNGKNLISTSGIPGDSEPVFKEGTLTVSGDLASTINIKLENGRVVGKDGKECILNISYSGPARKY